MYGDSWPTEPPPDPMDDLGPLRPLGPVGPLPEGDPLRESGVTVLEAVRAHLSRYISTMTDDDLDILTLWAAHTHLVMETYTTPRLVLDSPVPGSGKTTTLEHLERLCVLPVQMASVTSPALLARLLVTGIRTILIDEADRSLDPKRDGVEDLLAILNSGYKRGGSRPVLTPSKGGGWNVDEMPTYAPVAMAGNNPNLPEDTKSRSIRVLLLPDLDGRVEDSDWELIEDDARAIGARLAHWADRVRDCVRSERPSMPEGIRGRFRERWYPLKRVAYAAGGRWPETVDALALHDLEAAAADREDGMVRDRPAVILMRHLFDLWPEGEEFVSSSDLITDLVMHHPDVWGTSSSFGKALTYQRMGRMLATAYKVNTTRPDHEGPRGYTHASLTQAWRALGISPRPEATTDPAPPPQSGPTGRGGPSGPRCPRHGTDYQPDRCWTCEQLAETRAVS